MSAEECRIFVDELVHFAAQAADPALSAVADRVAAPLRVAVRGRPGVGRGTVAHALSSAGLDVTDRPAAADVDVYVIAEVVKPEDRAAIAVAAAARRPVLVVLNKADLTGRPPSGTTDGPIAAARSWCMRLSELTGAPTEPMVGILAAAAADGLPDARMWAALQVLAAHILGPAAARTSDQAAGGDRVPAEQWRRLLERLDLFGIAHALAAVRQGRPAAEVGALLRHLSCLDTVIDRLTALGREVHYRRILDAVEELEALAVTDRRINDFLCRDDTVVARMADAVDVVKSAGLPVDRCQDRDAYLRRAVHWQRDSREAVSAVRRACGVDIARGSLRLWSRMEVSR